MAPRLSPEALHLLTGQCGVIATWQRGAPSSDAMLRAHQRGHWRRISRYTYAASPAALSDEQLRWAAVLHCGPQAVLTGRTALVLAGWKGGEDGQIPVAVPTHYRRQHPRWLTPVRRTYLPNSRHKQPPHAAPPEAMVDAVSVARTERQGVFLVLSVLQAGLADPADIHRVLEDRPRVHRRRLIRESVAEFADGITTMGERDFTRLCREYGLREPDRQVRRKDGSGRSRYLDAFFEKEGIVVEIDGLGHLDLEVWIDDQTRQNDIVIDTACVFMRTSTVALRYESEVFMDQLLRALTLRRDWGPQSGP